MAARGEEEKHQGKVPENDCRWRAEKQVIEGTSGQCHEIFTILFPGKQTCVWAPNGCFDFVDIT